MRDDLRRRVQQWAEECEQPFSPEHFADEASRDAVAGELLADIAADLLVPAAFPPQLICHFRPGLSVTLFTGICMTIDKLVPGSVLRPSDEHGIPVYGPEGWQGF